MYERNQTRPIAERIAASRVDMLIAIYEAAIEATENAARMLLAGQDYEAAMRRSQALALVGLIESGLDMTQGEIPKRIKELCGFIEQSLLSSKPDQIAAAARILRNLHDGFVGIKAEARTLEDMGTIPQLAINAVDTLV